MRDLVKPTSSGRLPQNRGTYRHLVSRIFGEWFRDVHGASEQYKGMKSELSRAFDAGFRKGMRWANESREQDDELRAKAGNAGLGDAMLDDATERFDGDCSRPRQHAEIPPSQARSPLVSEMPSPFRTRRRRDHGPA